jgi:hypothetical protein
MIMKGENLTGKWAVITGGSSGIGLEYANTLARRSANILLISNQPEELKRERSRLIADFHVKCYELNMDLTSPTAANDVIAFMEQNWIEPYIFINNAGIFSFGEVVDTPLAKIAVYINLHIRVVTELSRIIAKRMAAQETTGRAKGYILNMSSMSCWMPMPGIALYSATKAYIRTFTRALHYEMRDAGVRVMVCCPGGIATDLFGLPPKLMKLALKLHAVDTPTSFTEKAINKLLKGKKQYINGFLNRLTILFVGVMPTSVRMLIKHKMLDKGIKVKM